MTNYTFLSRNHVGLNFTDGPTYDQVNENVPDWLTYSVSQDILYAVNSCKQAVMDTSGLAIYIPLNWVSTKERWLYRPAQLFGVDMRLNEYVLEPQVAFNVSNGKKKAA